MISFYTILISMCWMSLLVLCILVHENSWIPKKDKTLFYLSYAIIAVSALAEWLGIQFGGNDAIPAWLLALVKCFDYILTPMTGAAVVAQMKLRNLWFKALMTVLIFNAVFQIIASFNHWMIVIDDHNHYTHGPLYGVYIALYFIVIILTAAEFLVFSLSYRKRNRISLFSVFIMMIICIVYQEATSGAYRTAYIGLTISVALLFIHYSEFYKMAADEHIRIQRKQLMKDALCGIYSRYAYERDIERFNHAPTLPDNFTVFVIDINGLKVVNDNIGHNAGDVLIIGAARCIEKAVGNAGRCYRTGGDEFIVLANLSREQADDLVVRLDSEAANWSCRDFDISLSLSSGYARKEDFQDYTVEEIVKKADQAMYAAKAEYYLSLNP